MAVLAHSASEGAHPRCWYWRSRRMCLRMAERRCCPTWSKLDVRTCCHPQQRAARVSYRAVSRYTSAARCVRRGACTLGLLVAAIAAKTSGGSMSGFVTLSRSSPRRFPSGLPGATNWGSPDASGLATLSGACAAREPRRLRSGIAGRCYRGEWARTPRRFRFRIVWWGSSMSQGMGIKDAARLRRVRFGIARRHHRDECARAVCRGACASGLRADQIERVVLPQRVQG